MIVLWLLCLAGFSLLSLAMPRYRRLFGLRHLSARAERGWRLSGFALLLLSLLLVLQRPQPAEDVITWFGILTITALLVASVLAYRQRR
ncbi:hypothetical protein J2X32_000628 [Rheinheimera pacifica]|uniref:DUF3325 domain-containing protein n=1 Tax=Rheinheimera pacifica TaxID=173990 RepID=UPI0028641C90|nr:DUF3325 domain-containing protein [Rheinheimera pacifica]MDR6982020.1 hypothetical protein [Rheinheimera pacifica]